MATFPAGEQARVAWADDEECPPEERDARLVALADLDALLEKPMAFLGFVWLALLVAELVWGLPPGLAVTASVIWGLFVVDFFLKLVVAPEKVAFLRREWLTGLSLLVPALRFLRVFSGLGFLGMLGSAQGVGVLRAATAFNNGLRTLHRVFSHRGVGYVAILNGIVTLVGAAGMYACERGGKGFETYGDAVWFTAMLITSIGSEAWPKTSAGRVLGFVLGVYGMAMFGYVTAALASLFVGSDAKKQT